MPLPCSRTALDRLSRRLAGRDTIDPGDETLLVDVLAAYQDALNAASSRLASLGFEPATRVKTVGTLTDKLRREPGSKLKSVQDVAGARIVVTGGRDEQDDVVAAIERAFGDAGRPPRTRDRRAEPSHGYRAVHVVVFVEGLPVEVQVRTTYQDLWAQAVERLGDAWGRGLRYGEGPEEPEAPVSPGSDSLTRRDVFAQCMRLSAEVNSAEEIQVKYRRLARSLPQVGDLAAVQEELRRSLTELDQAISDDFEEFRFLIDRLTS